MTYSPRALISPAFLRQPPSEVVSPNERNILKLIWRQMGISRSELTGKCDLTQQSVYRIIDGLVERAVLEMGPPKAGAGRGQPSPTLRFNSCYAYSVGISVNTDTMGICLMSFSGQILATDNLALHGVGMDAALDQAETIIAQHIEQLELDPSRLFGIGFAIAGFRVSGTQYNAPLPLHEWSLVELGPLLSRRFSRPVWVHNGANTGAVAEAMFGVGRYIRDFAYLSFNYGFGGGLICDGELLVGGNGNAGEFSGMFHRDESPDRPALQYLIEILQKNGVDIPSISYMRRHFDPFWPGVDAWIERVAPMQARLVNAIAAVFDPTAIVFGGQVPRDLAVMLIEKSTSYDQPRYGVYKPRPKLIVSDIADDASALGAAVAPFKAEFY
ncbi:ROK family transcriptional regulator [Pelagibacterium sp. H642]|uniref:ROK family protein n=1 Tax=Pelagibacterium sp. H642 TaxID=1881069 RepID=UPI0028164140|nr:ROK family transcriptional regulator [Pelagibacterium sp. H642]WMT90435.1 ROK family transcriptional regulator [Pelagibacterium sp. H642]